MIFIELYSDVDGNIDGFSIKGHADYAEYGNDVVCAAVSMIAQTTALALQELLHIPIELTMEKGYMACFVPKGCRYGRQWEDAQLLFKTLKLGLENIEETYRENIRVIMKGV